MGGRYYSDEIVKKLTSMGCAFGVEPMRPAVDLEKFILESLKYYWLYNDIFFMTYSLLKTRLSKLVHVERLVALAQNAHLSSDELTLLIALSNKLSDLGDFRYKLVAKKLNQAGLKMTNPPENETASHLIKTWGEETSLLPFGAKVRAFYEVDKKKFIHLKGIYQINSWLKLRAMFGPNYRADIVYLKSSGIAKTAYQASKIAGCNTSTATRIWKALEFVPQIEKLVADH